MSSGTRKWIVFIAAAFLFCGTIQAQKKGTPHVRQTIGKTQKVTVPMAVLTAEMMRNAPRQESGFLGQPRLMHSHVPPGYEWIKKQANERKDEALRRLGSTYRPGQSSVSRLNPGSLGTEFAGMNFSDTTCDCLPPDTIAAAGPNHIIETVNTAIRISDKAGNALLTEELSAFFAPLGLGAGGDPQVLYDSNADRFIVENFTGDFTGLELAVSIDGNPLDGFNEWQIVSGEFPDFAKMGISQTELYVADDDFAEPSPATGSAEIRVFQLSELYAGSASLTINLFHDVVTASGYYAFAIEPAHTYGSTNNEYLVASASPDFDPNPTNQLNLFSINTTGTPVLSALDLTVAAWSEPPSADQPGSPSSVATDSSFLLNAVWNNSYLVTAHQVASADLAHAVAQYFVINLPDSTGLPGASVADTGILGTGDTYYPAIAVRSDGSVGVVYNESSATEYISMYGAGRVPTDPAGVMGPPLLLFAGTVTNGFSFRWGDYSGISIDPVDNSFWMAAEPAGTLGSGIWQTEIADVFLQQTSTTTLVSSIYTSMFNQPLTLTATVTPQLGGPVTGNVTFYNNGAFLGSSAVSGNTASLTVRTLSVGSHPEVEAVYDGSDLVQTSLSNDVLITVKKASTTTVEISSLNPSHLGQTVTFTATVTPLYGGTPTGTVTFKKGLTILAIEPVIGGVATYSTNSLPLGNNYIRAYYGGDKNFKTSSYSLLQVVTH